MRVLISAYACGPGMGSEPEVGFQAVRAALRAHEVWVLTQSHMVGPVMAALPGAVAEGRLTVHGIDPPATRRQDGLVALVRTQVRHERWQRTAAHHARALHADVGFDVVHHVTLAAYWMRAGAAVVDAPLVWGPVGGAVEPPAGLLPVLGARGLLEDAVRTVVRRTAWRLPDRRAVVRCADVVLAQNAETAHRLRGARQLSVLPNALSASVPASGPGLERRRDVAVVGRVVAWKGVPLAVAALLELPDDVHLHVYGGVRDDQRRRVERAAEAAGVAHRVVLEGQLPRPELLRRIATSGVLLHPSLHDESPVALAEALALGTPVVALAHGGPLQVVAAWGSGAPARLVAPSTPARTARALGQAVAATLADPPPVPAQPVLPGTAFDDALLAAYELAASSRRGG